MVFYITRTQQGKTSWLFLGKTSWLFLVRQFKYSYDFESEFKRITFAMDLSRHLL